MKSVKEKRGLTVSVVIPTYNYGRFVATAIESALAQTRMPLEVIVVDDGSTDDTAAVVARFGDSVRYIHKPNGGLSSARNAGIAAARGDLIALLDADDRWLPHKLERQVPYFAADKDMGLVHTGSRIFDHETGGTLCEVLPRESLSFHELMNCCAVSAPSTMIRRGIFQAIGGFDETLAEAEDWDMWIRIAAAGWKVAGRREILVEYRTHSSNMSRSNPLRHYRNCMVVLRKSLRIHARCGECEAAVRDARKRLAGEMYDQMSAKARHHLRTGDIKRGLEWRWKSVRHYPGVLLRAPEIIRNKLQPSRMAMQGKS
jgi:glycosyltransferase involved in cell wall biosynthesis